MNIALLAQIVTATLGNGFVYASLFSVADMAAAGFVEQNPNMVNPENADELATRATQAGIDHVNATATTETQVSVYTTAPVPSTTMTDKQASFARAAFKPPVKGKGTREVAEKYPFGDLAAPDAATGNCDSFFVAKSAAVEDPMKTLTSACSAANRRYATIVGTREINGKPRNQYDYSRKFEVFDGTHDQSPTGNPGVWVARTK